ncbi:hypothetical protein [Rubrimonas cliftonensis]|uniref:hypothetical protein n=1 Tax=Rubrimonas cliftonensis TaxID=89524 RepID=UPI0015878936|nr:hypothetical protein [Rubrimonas cliftonensis]
MAATVRTAARARRGAHPPQADRQPARGAILLGDTRIESAPRHRGVDVEAAPGLSEAVDIR